MGSKQSKIVRNNESKKKRNTANRSAKQRSNQDIIPSITTETPKEKPNDVPAINNEECRPNTTQQRSLSYPKKNRRSRLPSSSSAVNNYFSMMSSEDLAFQSKSNISSGWTALSNDRFSQIDVNTSTFTLITEHSSLSRKSVYRNTSPLSTSSQDMESQLRQHPSSSFHLIKEAFQKAQVRQDWSQFYTAIEHYSTESHDPAALVYHAMCLISGLGCVADVQRGFDLLKAYPSCETSYALGHCYLDGLPVQPPHTIQPIDKSAAFDYFSKAANDYEPTNESAATTVAEAQCRLARMLFQGEGVEQNSEEAMEYLMKSAENNNRYAQFLIGVHCECGIEIPQDLERAKRYYEKSAQQGFPDAQAALGNRWVVEGDYEQGLPWLEKAVQKGNSRAHVQLAMLYDKGLGVEQDDATALLHYKTAAENNNRAAQYLLGLVYYFGRLGAQNDPTEAIRWIRQAANAGYPYAQRVLGQFYQHAMSRVPIRRNEREAIRWYKRAAINKDMIALDLLGRAYQHGLGVEIDLEKALAYYTKAAEMQDSRHVYYAKMDQALLLQHMSRHAEAFQIHSEILAHADPVRDKEPIELAKLSLGRYHLRSDIHGIPHNPSLSFKLWTELVETTQHPDAFYWLGSCYDEGIPGVCEIDRVKAFLLFTTAAELGDIDAMFTVAGMMSNYLIPNKGPSDAFPWYQKAALQGHVRSMYALGLCYHRGIGTERDIEMALEWLERASKQGVTEAMSYMAKIYLQLRTTDDQYSIKAAQWLKRAAEADDVYAQRELGKIYLSGQGLAENHAIAFQLLQKATLKNDPEAMAFLGHCYRKGTGVDKDLAMASEYYLKSASLGYAFAYSAAAELYYENRDFELAYNYYLLASKVPGMAQTKTGMTARLMVARLTLGYIPTDNQKTLKMLKNSIQSDTTKSTSVEEVFEILFNLAVEDQFILAFEPLGYCYMNGLGTEVNMMQASIWFRKAAEGSKSGTAEFRLYEIYSRRADIPQALSFLRQSADLGYTEAQHRLSMIHLRGEYGLLPDDRTATEWLKKSAAKLHAPSLWTLSQMAGSIGQDGLQLEYQKSAASLGYVPAMRELGKHFLKQASCVELLDEALGYFHMAADLDDVESLLLLGKTYANCTRTLLTTHLATEDEINPRWQSEEDEKALAIQCFEKASDLGSLDATVYAAEAWHEQQQYAAAFEHFQNAASQGHVLARFFCARYSIEGFGGIPTDYEKGFKELFICANELHYVHAYNTLGQCYENGVAVQKNDELAYQWYCRAAEATGDSEAYYRMGQMYVERKVNLPNKAMNRDMEAFKVYKLAVSASPKGHGPSCYELGLYYFKGIVDPLDSTHFFLTPDVQVSIDYFRTASDLGIKEAMTELGVILIDGKFSLEEQAEGLSRLELAAELGSAEAQFRLGLFHHEGDAQDLMKAYDLFCRSAAQGHASSTYYIALYHHHGFLDAPDLNIALDQYQVAVDLFTTECDERWQAEYNLARLLPMDSRAYELFQAAQAHAPQEFKYLSQTMIARYHLYGWAGVSPQPKEAAAFLIRFTQERYGYRVYLDVAQCFEKGLGVTQDLQEAFYWYGEVMGRKDDESDVRAWVDEDLEEEQLVALVKLANFYRQGQVVKKDVGKAELLEQLAAKKHSIIPL